MIAGGIRNHAARQLLAWQLREHVERAADLEGPHRLEVFAFQEQRGVRGLKSRGTIRAAASAAARPRHFDERRDPRKRADAF